MDIRTFNREIEGRIRLARKRLAADITVHSETYKNERIDITREAGEGGKFFAFVKGSVVARGFNQSEVLEEAREYIDYKAGRLR
jgi:hypothetical protein